MWRGCENTDRSLNTRRHSHLFGHGFQKDTLHDVFGRHGDECGGLWGDTLTPRMTLGGRDRVLMIYTNKDSTKAAILFHVMSSVRNCADGYFFSRCRSDFATPTMT